MSISFILYINYYFRLHRHHQEDCVYCSKNNTLHEVNIFDYLQTYTSKVRHLQYFVAIKIDPHCHDTRNSILKLINLL